MVSEANLPTEFVRTNWTSSEAQMIWEQVFSDCSNFIIALEVEAILAGLRRVTIHTCNQDKLIDTSTEMMELGLSVIPIDKIQITGTYQSSSFAVDLSKPWQYKVAIGDWFAVQEFSKAYKAADNAVMGELLGYPECCTAFFQKYWVDDKWLDTSYPMSGGAQDFQYGSWSPYCNILLRWLGMRYVSHLPCGFNCTPTETLGMKHFQLAVALGQRTRAEMLLQILAWPVEWSALHGIGTITTPVCRTTFRTDSWNDVATIRLHSSRGPREAARGLGFPFTAIAPHNCKDNGFNSEWEQARAHNVILDLLRGTPPKSAIDLGCGNMALLHKIHEDFGAETFGVDATPSKRPSLAADIFTLDDFPNDYDVALISKARIHEHPLEWPRLLRIIERRCKHLLVYTYNHDTEDFFLGDFSVFCGITDQEYVAELFRKTKTADGEIRTGD